MFWLYFIALIPIVVGLGLKLAGQKVDWAEYEIGVALALITAGIFHVVSYQSQIGDNEIWSGSILQTRQYSEWTEYYEYAVYRTEYYTDTESYTDSKGNRKTRTVRKSRQVFDHWEPTTRTHKVHWDMDSNIDTTYQIDREHFNKLVGLFGGAVPVAGNRRTGEHNSRMKSGDPNDYVAVNKTGYIEPVNKSVYFENRVRASSSIFKKRKLSTEEQKSVLPYPEHINPYVSNRLMGTASKHIDSLAWEQLNGYLGPIKKINLICVGYAPGDAPDKFDKQIAFWQGGKKNDFIIGFGDGWARVYSWSESEIAKLNVEQLFLQPSSKTLLDDLKKEILHNYTKVEWTKKFQYLVISPTTSHVICYLVVLIVTQAGLYVFFHHQEILPSVKHSAF